jgi:hypothetical protein
VYLPRTHPRTQLDVIRRFLEVKIAVEEIGPDVVEVRVG